MRLVEFVLPRTLIGPIPYLKDERKWFDDDVAQRYIDNGWVKCCETGEQKEPPTQSVKVVVKNSRSETRTK